MQMIYDLCYPDLSESKETTGGGLQSRELVYAVYTQYVTSIVSIYPLTYSLVLYSPHTETRILSFAGVQ